MKYSKEAVNIAMTAMTNKSLMMKLALNKSNRHIIEETTSFLHIQFPIIPIKFRCWLIINDIDESNYPKCGHCGKFASWDKEYSVSINRFCSDKCSKVHGRLSSAVKEKLADYDWLYQKRIVERMSVLNIGILLGCSEIPVSRAIKELKIPKIKLNESEHSVKVFLHNKEWLIEQHVTLRKTCKEIGEDIGTSKAAISLALANHDIIANATNSYPRKFNKISKEENTLLEFVKSLVPNNIIKQSDRKILEGQEIDILLPELNIGFEYNGIISHIHSHHKGIQNGNKEKNYHYNKTKNAENKGVKLFHIFSDDWTLNKEVVKGLIAAKLGYSEHTIFARKCEISLLQKFEKSSFLNMYHMQGNDKSSIEYGLKYNGDIVALMTFCKSRYNKNANWELSRFVVKKYYNVPGAFSKLLAAFRRNHSGTIISYADRSYSDGGVYIKNGFTLLHENKAGYKYVKNGTIKRLHRAAFMKAKIAPNDPRPEWEIMFDLGYKQIYDCGTLSFLLE